MRTAFTDLVGIEHPLIQAPMAGVSTPEMAAAVSESGALGSVALGSLGPDAARRALRATRALTDAPIAANVFVHETPQRDTTREAALLGAITPAFEDAGAEPPASLTAPWTSFNDSADALQVLLEERPEVVSLHFGSATPEAMDSMRSAGIAVLATATTLAEAEVLEAAGVDAIVVQGYGAGGHSGAFLAPPDRRTEGLDGLVDLVAETAEAIAVPVVAAGGLMTGADIRQVLGAGAAAAQLGTAFVPSEESSASSAYRRAVAAGGVTRMTTGVSGRPARGLVNELFTLAETVPRPLPDYPITYGAMRQLMAAKDEPEFVPMWAGVGVDRSRPMSAADLVATLVRELADSS